MVFSTLSAEAIRASFLKLFGALALIVLAFLSLRIMIFWFIRSLVGTWGDRIAADGRVLRGEYPVWEALRFLELQ